MPSSRKSTWSTNLILVATLTLILSLNVTAQNYEWVKSAGGPTKVSSIFPGKIHVDASGNTYLTGSIHKQVTFDNVTIAPSTVTSYGDIFITKYDSNGKLEWIKQDGGTGNEYAQDIEVDAQGNVYVLGFFSKVFDGYKCEISGVSLISDGSEHEYFLAKYDARGTLIWVKQTYNSGHTMDPQGQIALDTQGNIIMQGSYIGEIGFGGKSLKNDGKSYSMFVAKYTSSGTPVWVTTHFSHINYNPYSSGNEIGDYMSANGLVTDNDNNIYITGNFKGTLDFAGDQVKSQGTDMYLVKLSSSGQHLWHKVTGSVDHDYTADVEIDSKGNPYWLIYTNRPKIGTASNSKDWGTFIAKLDQNGNAYEISSIIEYGFCTAIAIGKEDRVYAIGHFSPTARVDCVVLESTSQNNDAFFISQDVAGNLQWIKEVQGLYGIMTLDIQVDKENNAYGLGYFRGDISFDNINVLNIGGANTAEQGLFTDDMFLAKVNNIDVYAPPASMSLSCEIPQTSSINNNTTLTATLKNANAPVSYSWDLGNGDTRVTTNPTLNYTYSSAGKYFIKIQATDNLGCNVICSSNIIVSGSVESGPVVPGPNTDILIPNIFTPNGDGKNDVFTIANYTLDVPFQITIFNRWGKQVVALEDGVKGWNGENCAEGIYYYIIQINGEVKKGWIELVR
ncbi:gliding motility-associated C-terminal domain-containing protein [Pontibacter sp. KCTC 32443]|uniref:T9SS type B sorting domain-containing protein n=1 Tax=Pontibacter TaxID=323449 RepID=UPI00164E9F25|nr:MULTISPECIES: gliding motility-associated C-terminal domain-containing protein [Pontibacter]MBC5774266.1 gliding motility-associated C-terminal domain-containing protein [Pontibacter sp. KCTC 32443]